MALFALFAATKCGQCHLASLRRVQDGREGGDDGEAIEEELQTVGNALKLVGVGPEGHMALPCSEHAEHLSLSQTELGDAATAREACHQH